MLGNLDRTKQSTQEVRCFLFPVFALRGASAAILTTATSDHPERNFEDIGTEALALRRAGEHGDDHIADCVLRHQNPNLDSGLRRTNQKLG
jgi:hypothetical protein